MFDTVLTIVIANLLAPWIAQLVDLLLSIVFTIYCTGDDEQVTTMDEILMKRGYCLYQYIPPHESRTGVPAGGVHFMFINYGFICAIKIGSPQVDGVMKFQYKLYIFGTGARNAVKKIYNKQGKILTMKIYKPNEYSTTIITEYLQDNLIIAYDWQQKLADEMMEFYHTKQNCKILISGGSGVGKTTMGDIIYRSLVNKGKSPCLCQNFDLTTPGLLLDNAFGCFQLSEQEPLILMLDEFDCAVKNAMSDVALKDDKWCLAKNKSTLNQFLDRVARLQYLIVIATSNMRIEEFDANYHWFVRLGRFNIRYQHPHGL
jgi:hypothetical protein